MEETLGSCVVHSLTTSTGKWTCRSCVGEIYEVLETDPNEVQNSLLVNKIHLQSRKIQGIYSVHLSNLVHQSCFYYCLCKTEISLDFDQPWVIKRLDKCFRKKYIYIYNEGAIWIQIRRRQSFYYRREACRRLKVNYLLGAVGHKQKAF